MFVWVWNGKALAEAKENRNNKFSASVSFVLGGCGRDGCIRKLGRDKLGPGAGFKAGAKNPIAHVSDT